VAAFEESVPHAGVVVDWKVLPPAVKLQAGFTVAGPFPSLDVEPLRLPPRRWRSSFDIVTVPPSLKAPTWNGKTCGPVTESVRVRVPASTSST